MKELQNFVYRHMDALRHHKRYLAMLTALSMLVTFIVPLILIEPADSMTKQRLMLLSDSGTPSYPTSFGENVSGVNANMVPNAAGTDGNGANGNEVNGVTYSPAQMDILTLLFGAANDSSGKLVHQDLYAGCTTIEEALEVDKETYFLGYASDFCAFIEGDFTATDADAEGRIAVGGDLSFTKEWNYQVGSGDYEVMKPLQNVQWADDYRNVFGFASALVGGKMSRINTLSTGWGHDRSDINDRDTSDTGYHAVNLNDNNAYTVYYNPNEGLFKKFIVGDVPNSTHYSKNDGDVKDVPYYANSLNNESGNCKHDYPADCVVCKDNAAHSYLGNVNELAQMYSMPDGYTVRDLVVETFEYVRTRSDVLAHMQSIEGKAIYSYEGNFEKVLFDAAGVPENTKTVYFNIDEWKGEYTNIEFVNIPEGANIVINCGQETPVNITSDGSGSGKGDVKTSINGVVISKNGLSDQEYKNAGNANNHPDSARILYNFYNTNEVNIDGCFNGTILSPYADAKSAENCNGHLSGALIAKSYYGGLEFGYRPYRGSSDIFGMSAGYEIPVDKVIAGTGAYLPGAMFEIIEIDGNNENIISFFESANKTNIISLPTYIDYSGDTYYIAESVVENIGTKDITGSHKWGDEENTAYELFSPFELHAYTDSGFTSVIGNDEIPLQGKFYVKGSRVISLKNIYSESTPVYAYNNSGSDNYEVYLSKTITSADNNEVSFEVEQGGTSHTIKVKFKPMNLTVNSNAEIELGNTINLALGDYPTDGIQYKYFYTTDNGGNYTEIQNMNVTSGNFTPQTKGTYKFKAQAWYNNKCIAEATSGTEITVNIPEVQEQKSYYIVMDNENPRVGDQVGISVKDNNGQIINNVSWSWQNQNSNEIVDGNSLKFNNAGECIIQAQFNDNNSSHTITKTIYVNAAVNAKLWVSRTQINSNEGDKTIYFTVNDRPQGVEIVSWSLIYADNTSETDISQDKYNLWVKPNQVGEATLKVTLSNGDTLEQIITVIQNASDMKLIASSPKNGSSYSKGETITLHVEGAPNGADIQYTVLNSNYEDITLNLNISNGSFTSYSTGKLIITATVNGTTVPNQLELNVSDYTLNADPSISYLNQTVNLSVSGLPENVSKIEYYIADGNYKVGDDNTPYDNFTFTVLQAGTYTVKAIIYFNDGTTSEVYTSIETLNQQEEQVSYNLTRNNNIDVLADEDEKITTEDATDNDTNKIIITSDSGKTIKNVRLNTIHNNNNYILEAIKYDKDDNQIGESIEITKDMVQSNSYWADIDCSNTNTVKVVIKAISGVVKIKNCLVTWAELCKYVTKTYPANGDVSDTESYTINFETGIDKTDFTIQFVGSNLQVGIELLDSEGKKLNYNNGHAGNWDFGATNNPLFKFSEKITLDDGKQISDVAKVVISSPSSTKFKVGYYTVDTTVGENDEVATVPTDKVVEEHTYIIKETTAPVGYFKTDKNYKVIINESIAISDENIISNRYPVKSNATITIYESDETGTNYSEPCFNAELTIFNEYGDNYKPTKRTITYNDTIFTLLLNPDGTVISITPNVISDSTKPQEFKYGGKPFYFNPVTAMVIPFPESNLTFKNTSGLLFKKVDEDGLTVVGASIEIEVESEGGFISANEIWSWNSKTGKGTIDLNRIKEEPLKIYRINELKAPDGYEIAEPIYFKYDAVNNKILYAESKEGLNSECSSIDLNDNSNPTITMEDYRYEGVKLRIEKVDIDTLVNLENAVFALYAFDNNVLIKDNIAAGNGTGVDVDLTEITNDGEDYVIKKYDDNNEVEDAYLKPGMYYLVETTRPMDETNFPYRDPGKIVFNVTNDFKVKYSPLNENFGGTLTKSEKDAGWGDGTHEYWLNDSLGKSMQESNSGGSISNVKHIYVVLKPWSGNPIVLRDSYTNLIEGNIGGEFKGNPSQELILDLELDSPGELRQFKVRGTAIVFAYAKITTADNKEYIFEDASYTPPATEEEEETPVLQVQIYGSQANLKVGNEKDDGEVDITVNKVWDNSGFNLVNPDVIIKLYRTKNAITTEQRNNPSAIEGGEFVQEIILGGEIWSHTFEGLDSRYASEDNGYGEYHYYIIEEQLEGYKTEYSASGSNLSVTNTIETVSLPVKKYWSDDTLDKPASVTLQLQMNNNNDGTGPSLPQWVDVSSKTIELTAGGDWSGMFTGLIKGKTYRVVETPVDGWKVDGSKIGTVIVAKDGSITEEFGNDKDKAIDITNKPYDSDEQEYGNLIIQKLWDTTQGLPDSVYVKLYRKSLIATYPLNQPAKSTTNAEGNTIVGVQEDYARLLQYSLYFYDANMCGDLAGDHSALAWRSNCHTEDEDYGGVNGGFHDAGDHVMFGLPQGYSASMLGWSYYEFKDAYDNLEQTAHLKAITEHFCDFFEQCIRENNGTTEILVQKGDGNVDHGYWGAPEKQNEDATNHRKDEEQMFWVNDTGADIAAEYAAALALAYINFYDENADDAQKYRDYLTAAEKLYAYANSVKNNPVNTIIYGNQAPNGCLNDWNINLDNTQQSAQYPGFYKSEGCSDDIALAAAWLSIATNDDSYASACSDSNSSWALSWNDVGLAAAIANAHRTGQWDHAKNYVKTYADKGSSYYCQDAWGSARYNAIAQMATLAVAKNIRQTDSDNAKYYSDWAKSQMAILLGNNNWGENGKGVCLVTGFAENSSKYAHHRAASGWETHDEYKANSTYDSDSHALIGALVGGPSFKAHDEEQMKQNGHTNLTNSSTHGNYADDLHDYCCNEVALDYQAGLVGAAAGLYYFYETGHTYEIPGAEKQYLHDDSQGAQAKYSFGPQRVAMQKTAVNVLADESKYTLVYPYSVNNYKHGDQIGYDDFATEISDEEIKYIEFVFDRSGTFSGNIAFNNWNVKAEQISVALSGNVLGLDDFKDKLKQNNQETNLPTNISQITIQGWGDSIILNEIRFYTANNGSSGGGGSDTDYNITGTSSMTVNATESFEVSGMSGNITWSYKLNGGNANTINGYNSTTCQFTPTQAGSYEIIATDSSGHTASMTVEVTENSSSGGNTGTDTPTYTVTGDSTLTVGIEGNFTVTGMSGNITWSYKLNGGNANTINGYNSITCQFTPTQAGSYEIIATDSSGHTASMTVEVTENSSSGGNTNATAEVTTLDNYTVHKWDDDGDNWSWTSLGVDEGERVVKVEILLESNNGSNIGNFNGGMGTDGVSLKADGSGTEWYQKNLYENDIQSTQHIFTWDIPEHESRDINYTKSLKFGHWNNTMPNVNVKSITIYTIVEASIIGIPSDGLMSGKTVQLDTKGLTEPIEWTVSNDNAAEFDANVNGKLIAKNVESDTDVIITATDSNGNSVTDVIKIKSFTFGFDSNSTEFKVRAGKSIDIPFNTEETVTITFTDNEFVTHSGNTFTGVMSSNGTKYEFTATCNGPEITGTIEVLPEFTITSDDLVYSGDELTLEANDINGVSWEIISGGEYAELNGDKLKGKKLGTVVVKATDTTDGSTATQSIAVKLKAVNPGFDYKDDTYDLVFIDIIPITKSENWLKIIENLPITDEDGNYYMYYIVECDANGNIIGDSAVNDIQGAGTTFVPTEYQNGTILVSDLLDPVKVSVSNSLSGRVQGQLPSTGGSGVTTYYYLGGVIMLLSIAGFTSLKRRERKRRKE